MRTCVFRQINKHEVKCPHCGKHYSGTPEKYAGRIVCGAFGVGSVFARRLQTLADTLHFTFKECSSCLSMKVQMNINGPEWTDRNRKKLIEMIQKNAKAQNINVPKAALDLILSSAIKEERTSAIKEERKERQKCLDKLYMRLLLL